MPEPISEEELKELVRSASFRCPRDPPLDPRDCGGLYCPSRPEPICGCKERAHVDQPYRCPWREEDYYDECVNSLYAKWKLQRILAGELRVQNFASLIKLRRRFGWLVEKPPF